MAVCVAERRSELARIDRRGVVIEKVIDDQIATRGHRHHLGFESADPFEVAMRAQKNIEFDAARVIDLAGHQNTHEVRMLLKLPVRCCQIADGLDIPALGTQPFDPGAI